MNMNKVVFHTYATYGSVRITRLDRSREGRLRRCLWAGSFWESFAVGFCRPCAFGGGEMAGSELDRALPGLLLDTRTIINNQI